MLCVAPLSSLQLMTVGSSVLSGIYVTDWQSCHIPLITSQDCHTGSGFQLHEITEWFHIAPFKFCFIFKSWRGRVNTFPKIK